jgi:hypothetical protein
MSLIRWGAGSQLYIYQSGDQLYVCCGCYIKDKSQVFSSKQELKKHIIEHESAGHTIGEPGNEITYQSYKQLLQAVDQDDF